MSALTITTFNTHAAISFKLETTSGRFKLSTEEDSSNNTFHVLVLKNWHFNPESATLMALLPSTATSSGSSIVTAYHISKISDKVHVTERIPSSTRLHYNNRMRNDGELPIRRRSGSTNFF